MIKNWRQGMPGKVASCALWMSWSTAACCLQQTRYKSIQNQLTVELFVKWSQDARASSLIKISMNILTTLASWRYLQLDKTCWYVMHTGAYELSRLRGAHDHKLLVTYLRCGKLVCIGLVIIRVPSYWWFSVSVPQQECIGPPKFVCLRKIGTENLSKIRLS